MSGATLSSSHDERYSLRHVQASLGLSRAVIDGLVEAGFVSPARGPRNRRSFSFQDLMLLRTAHELREAKVAPKRIVEALATLRAGLPAGTALTGVRVSAIGSRVIVRDVEGARDAQSGQFVMDFDAPAVAEDEVAVEPLADTTATPTPRAPTATVHALSRPAASRARADDARDAASPPSDATAAYERGAALEASDAVGAEAAYRKALELDPSYVSAAVNLSAMLCDQHRAAEADALCIAVLARGVDDALLRFNHGLALDDLNRPRAALAAYRRALELEPGFADAHYNAACLLESMHDARGALRHFAAYRRLQGV